MSSVIIKYVLANSLQCDEHRPRCQRCQKSGLACSFPSHLIPSDHPTQSIAPEPVLQMLDLQLMHHYSTTVYATLTCDVSIQLAWRDSVVQLSLECDYMMRTLLAVSAIHLAKLHPENRDLYLSTAFKHHDIALESAMPLLSDPQQVDARNLFVFSSLTIFFG
jgi:hypothetical protein